MSSESPYKAPSKAETLRNYLSVPLLTVPFGITGYFVSKSEKGLLWFHYHPFLMLFSFFSLGGIAVLTKKIGGKKNTEYHGYLLFLATMVAGFGGYVIWSNKEMYGKAHLTTPHGQFGAFTLSMFLPYAWISYFLQNPENGFLKTNSLARKIHKYSGKLILSCGLLTCGFGIAGMEKNEIVAGGLIASFGLLTPFFLL